MKLFKHIRRCFSRWRIRKWKREGGISEHSREILETDFPDYLRRRMEGKGDD
jgi:hypothetical protein